VASATTSLPLLVRSPSLITRPLAHYLVDQTTNTQAYIKSLGSTYSGKASRPCLDDSTNISAGKYNATGRGYPDVAAQGVSVNIVSGGELEPVDGTSCASPIFASVIGLLNNELAAAGKPALGFLNPWLYSTAASALNDITSGANAGCNTKVRPRPPRLMHGRPDSACRVFRRRPAGTP
jgi:hypothetical protein